VTLKDIAYYRLHLQHISHTQFEKPEDIVCALGVLQAQDYLASLWAVGVRGKNITEVDVEQAIVKRKIIRTWPLRGTLHLVAAEDVRWILSTFAPRIIAMHANRLKRESEIDEKLITRCKKIIEVALVNHKLLTRDEVYHALEKKHIQTKNQRGLQILWRLAQDGFICFGPRQGKQHTFTLLDEWIPSSKRINREEGIVKLAKRYFNSHGPATVQDFAWWSGLTATEAKTAVELIKPKLISEKLNDIQYYFPASLEEIKKTSSLYLLPGFDEFLISYTDRRVSLDAPNHSKLINTVNGIFFPTVIINGKAMGTWKRFVKKDSITIEATAFKDFTDKQKASIIKEAKKYARFLDKKLDVA
jgi:hypothetical protein